MGKGSRAKLLVELSYLGTNYCGWQPQPGSADLPSVQDTLQAAMSEAGFEGGPVAAGRLDRGVHAKMQLVTVTTRRAQPVVPGDARGAELGAIRERLNAGLPADIRITRVRDAPLKAHAKTGCGAKTYAYYCLDGRTRAVDGCGLCCWVLDSPVDVDAVRRAAAALQGEHDFASLCSAPQSQATVRSLDRVEVHGEDYDCTTTSQGTTTTTTTH